MLPMIGLSPMFGHGLSRSLLIRRVRPRASPNQRCCDSPETPGPRNVPLRHRTRHICYGPRLNRLGRTGDLGSSVDARIARRQRRRSSWLGYSTMPTWIPKRKALRPSDDRDLTWWGEYSSMGQVGRPFSTTLCHADRNPGTHCIPRFRAHLTRLT